MGGEFNSPLLTMARTRQKKKSPRDGRPAHYKPTGPRRHLHNTPADKHTRSSHGQGTISSTGHRLSRKTGLSTFQNTEITQSVLTDHNDTELEMQ